MRWIFRHLISVALLAGASAKAEICPALNPCVGCIDLVELSRTQSTSSVVSILSGVSLLSVTETAWDRKQRAQFAIIDEPEGRFDLTLFSCGAGYTLSLQASSGNIDKVIALKNRKSEVSIIIQPASRSEQSP